MALPCLGDGGCPSQEGPAEAEEYMWGQAQDGSRSARTLSNPSACPTTNTIAPAMLRPAPPDCSPTSSGGRRRKQGGWIHPWAPLSFLQARQTEERCPECPVTAMQKNRL